MWLINWDTCNIKSTKVSLTSKVKLTVSITFPRKLFIDAWGGLGFSLCSSSFHKCSVWLRSGICVGRSTSSTPPFASHVFMELSVYTRALSCWNRFGLLSSSEEKLQCFKILRHFKRLCASSFVGEQFAENNIWVLWSGFFRLKPMQCRSWDLWDTQNNLTALLFPHTVFSNLA